MLPEPSLFSSERVKPLWPSKLPTDLSTEHFGLLRFWKGKLVDFTRSPKSRKEKLLMSTNQKKKDSLELSRKDSSQSLKSPSLLSPLLSKRSLSVTKPLLRSRARSCWPRRLGKNKKPSERKEPLTVEKNPREDKMTEEMTTEEKEESKEQEEADDELILYLMNRRSQILNKSYHKNNIVWSILRWNKQIAWMFPSRLR